MSDFTAEDQSHQTAAEAGLNLYKLSFNTVRHAPVMTAEAHKEWQVAAGAAGILAKNLFLKDKNKKLVLVVVTNDRKVDLKKLGVNLVHRNP